VAIGHRPMELRRRGKSKFLETTIAEFAMQFSSLIWISSQVTHIFKSAKVKNLYCFLIYDMRSCIKNNKKSAANLLIPDMFLDSCSSLASNFMINPEAIWAHFGVCSDDVKNADCLQNEESLIFQVSGICVLSYKEIIGSKE